MSKRQHLFIFAQKIIILYIIFKGKRLEIESMLLLNGDLLSSMLVFLSGPDVRNLMQINKDSNASVSGITTTWKILCCSDLGLPLPTGTFSTFHWRDIIKHVPPQLQFEIRSGSDPAREFYNR